MDSLRDRIPDFGGYLNEEDRRRSDELVRSYVGEAIAVLQDRVAPATPDPRFERTLLRAGFMNQIAFKAFEYAALDEARIYAVSRNDLRLVNLADRAPTTDAKDVDAYLAEVAAAFDARDRGMESPAA